MDLLQELKNRWERAGNLNSELATRAALQRFEVTAQTPLPADLSHYFQLINGSNKLYDEGFFCFYSLSEVQSIPVKFRDYHGIPKYSDLLHTLPSCERYYVFADYEFHLMAYAIRLDSEPERQAVYVLCGGKYRLVASDFTAFLEAYLYDPDSLLF